MRVATSDVVVIILASGRGQRIGCPKALLPWTNGMPLAVAHAQAALMLGAKAVVVVRADVAIRLRPVFRKLRSGLSDPIVVTSSSPSHEGPAGSIAASIHAGTLSNTRWCVFAPVDTPPPSSETFCSLIEAAVGDVEAVRVRWRSRVGHPVLVRSSVVASAYLGVQPVPLRTVLGGVRCAYVDVDDPNVVANINTLEEYVACCRSSFNRAESI